jgi:sugar phosphate isomerase/epimerase
MYKNLGAGAIGIRGLSLEETIKLAKETGYAGVEFNIREAAKLADEQGLDYVRNLFESNGIRPGHWALPFAWNQDNWQEGLADLPHLAEVGRDLGCTRTSTWCPSWSDERDFDENYQWHISRFGPIAEVLARYDCRFGIEFIGPKTIRANYKYEFIYSLEGMMKLAEDIGTGNVGLLLDAWHLYTSGGTLEDLYKITADDVVVVHINDAPAGIERDEQIDQVRCLPMETGVIDLPGFMQKLQELGYDGPVTTEPFNKPLNELAAQDPAAAARKVSEAMDRLWQAAGLPKD